MESFCTNCGKARRVNARFCPRCGSEFSSHVQPWDQCSSKDGQPQNRVTGVVGYVVHAGFVLLVGFACLAINAHCLSKVEQAINRTLTAYDASSWCPYGVRCPGPAAPHTHVEIPADPSRFQERDRNIGTLKTTRAASLWLVVGATLTLIAYLGLLVHRIYGRRRRKWEPFVLATIALIFLSLLIWNVSAW